MDSEDRERAQGGMRAALDSGGGSVRPRASTKGALAAAGKHDIITVEGAVLPHPGQSVYQALTVH